MKKFCTRCGNPFEATGREVICPSCKAQAAEDAKRAAVERAKRASWAGESVPVRISGRASTVIREYGAGKGLSFVQALDALLQSTAFFKGTGSKWEDIPPYKSRRRDKQENMTEMAQDTASKPQDEQEVKQEVQAAKVANKTSTTAKKVAGASKAAGKAGKKA